MVGSKLASRGVMGEGLVTRIVLLPSGIVIVTIHSATGTTSQMYIGPSGFSRVTL